MTLIVDYCMHPTHIFSVLGYPGLREFKCRCGDARITMNVKENDGLVRTRSIDISKLVKNA